MLIVSFIMAVLLGCAVGYLFGKRGEKKEREELLAQTEGQLETLRAQLEALRAEGEGVKVQLETAKAQLEATKVQQAKETELLEANHRNLLASEREKWAAQLESLKTGFEAERKALKELNERYQHSEEEMQVRTEQMKKEFQNVANQILENKSAALKETNQEQLGAILSPLKLNLEQLNKSVTDSRVSGAQYKESIETAIKGLMNQTEKIGNDAVNLTKALKANPKVQGDWGEMILERMLEESGLRRDEEYFVQENCVTEEGRNVRPDVIVRFPEERCVIIDSKVSLTAYVNYINAVDEAERKEALTAHLNSVRAHVQELAEKDYSKVVKNSIGYVLMFVPNEGSYIAAVEHDKELLNYAYKRGIIVISPSNLMMALQLAYNLWQSEKQSKNVEEIIRQGNRLYEKFVTFAATFEKMGDKLEDARKQYDTALGTLSKGNGNIVRSLLKMKSLGLSPKREIPEKLLEASDEDLLPLE